MDTVLISTAEEQLKRFGTFLEKHEEKLKSLIKQQGCEEESAFFLPPLVETQHGCGENLAIIELLESDRALNKTLLTFAHLCKEIKSIAQEASIMQQRFIYMDEDIYISGDDDSNGQNNNEHVLLKMSAVIQLLFHIQFMLQRCSILGNNLLYQCGALLNDNEQLEFRLFNVFDALTELMMQILIFDEIIPTSNCSRLWLNYKRTVESFAQNAEMMTYCTPSELKGLTNCLQDIDFIFSKTIFRNFLDSSSMLKEKIGAKGMGRLVEQCNEYMKHNIAIVDTFQINNLNDFDEPQLLIRLNTFCIFFYDFGGQIDSKNLKRLLELNAKHQGIILIGNICWNPSLFLSRHADSLLKSYQKLLQDDKRQHELFLSSRQQTLQRDCRAYLSQATLWALQMRKSLGIDAFDLHIAQFKELATLLLGGHRLAGQISFLVKALVNAHIMKQTPMTKHTLLSICHLIETMKLLQDTYQVHSEQICKLIPCILQYIQYKLLHLLSACKKKVTARCLRDRTIDALAAIKIAEKCMSGPPTNTRLLITKLAINVTNANERIMPMDQYEKCVELIKRIEMLCNFQMHLHQVCNMPYLYWHRSMVTAYLRQVLDRKLELQGFVNLINASNDSSRALDALELSGDVDIKLSKIVKKMNYENINYEIISGLCAQTEIFLRLEVHTNLQLNRTSPFEQKTINDYRDLINSRPILHDGQYVILKDHVENYLSSIFYNLTTISLHDWKTYEEMRHLAQSRLALRAVDDYLPNQTLEQGIDILEIMRKIHIFVSKYVYNMNSQIFVERQSPNKHLDSIGISHVANSLRTHGAGVINTTVNFIYQFLRQKFYTFSQFLYDEQIKSRLMKELRFYTDRKRANNVPLYPYERADAFNKDIRKLGLSNDDQTYMDLFRLVITHVGNAIGYVRLVRSGNIHANYNASLFLPKFDENLQFVEQCKYLNLHEDTILAAENFKLNVNNLVRSFSDSTDYFKLLVEVFEPFFRNPHNSHLKHFFLIVPSLILNYVQYILSAKEKISKRDRKEAIIFDDGFAVGLAYILKLLNQENDFYALHWFDTIRERFNTEHQKIQQMLAEIKTSKSNTTKNDSEGEKLQQTFALTERRITTHQHEYNLLYYNLNSAKIFFQ